MFITKKIAFIGEKITRFKNNFFVSRAQELGINIIDADHFCTENPVIPVLRDQLAKQFPATEFIVSKKHNLFLFKLYHQMI